jgi:RNA:NAD 2'-phosphotransferase (TPT1/KptA family)
MAFLLRHHPEVGGLTLDDAGWTELPALVAAMQKLVGDPALAAADIVTLVEADRKGRYAIEGERIRALNGHTFGGGPPGVPGAGDARAQAPADEHEAARESTLEPAHEPASASPPAADPSANDPAAARPASSNAPASESALPPATKGLANKPREPDAAPPDVLYVGTSAKVRDQVLGGAGLGGKGRHALLVASEARAWKLARRLRGQKPCVLYVDARRAHKGGVTFQPAGHEDFEVEFLPRRFILNARSDFRFQLSAGTVLWRGAIEAPEVALIRVGRETGESWELPKGKLQRGEAPLQAALRETREELNLGEGTTLEAGPSLGQIHYAFHVPGGRPRLKTVAYFLARVAVYDPAMAPRTEEGIQEVRWFPLAEALAVVTHENVRRTLTRAAEALRAGGGREGARAGGGSGGEAGGGPDGASAPRRRRRRRRRRREDGANAPSPAPPGHDEPPR